MSEQTYTSYLLRLWRDHTRSPWRATVIDVARPGEHQHFASLDALFAFLITQTGPAPPPAYEQVNASIGSEHDHCTPAGAPWKEALE
jgi:hypothetical protein